MLAPRGGRFLAVTRNDNGLEWSLRGPDADGAVWIDLSLGTFNLGAPADVRERIEGFLAFLDFAAQQEGSSTWALSEVAGNVILSWTGPGAREDVDLGRVGPAAEAFAEWLVESDPE